MSKHSWKFFQVGGFDQVQIATGDDVAHLKELDPKLWVAIASPSKHLDFDAHTLEILDTDGDGRVRVPEVIAAAEWICRVLEDPDELFDNEGEVPLSSIDTGNEDGKRLAASAKQLLKDLGKADAKTIAPSDTLDTAAIFAKTLFNGDGIVPPESAEEDEETAQAIRDVIECFGADKDVSGLDGVTQEKVDQLFVEATAYVEWWRASQQDTAVIPLGEDTAAAWQAFAAVRPKVNDYFTRCSLAAMDARGAATLNPAEADLVALSSKELSTASEALAALPIAHVEAERSLPLSEGLNPAFAGAVATFASKCVGPLMGARTELSHADWTTLSGKLAAHEAWLGTKPANGVEKLGTARLEELVDGKTKAAIDALIAKDKELEPEAKAIAEVDRLVHYYAHFAKFLHNFVSFEDFYGQRDKASFQSGTLYLDGRSFQLTMKVTDPAKHAALAGHSMACLAYCDCVRGAEKMSIVAAVTNGDSDFLMVGRNGVFYDRKGQDWDATITKIVEQPISVRQAFWSPYKKVARFVTSQIEKFAGEREAQSDTMMQSAATAPPVPAAGAPAPAAAPAAPAGAFDIAKFAGIFAAIGLALGALGAALAAVLTGFMGLTWWQMPLVIAGALLVISGPSMLMAALKLRQRNLGPLLDASGWAINARARINIPFGAALTELAALPPGSTRSLEDPYADKKRPIKTYLFIALVLFGGLYLGRNEIKTRLRPHVQSIPVIREWVAEDEPAAEATAPAEVPAPAEAPAP